MTTPTVRITAATPEETSLLYQFYNTQADPNVLPRPETDLRKSVEEGLFFKGDSGGNLVAVAGVFSLGRVPCVELGGTFVAPAVRGYGLQRLLFQLRIAATVVKLSVNYLIVTAIDPSNIVSRNNALRSGFEELQTPDLAMLESCAGCPKRSSAENANRQCCCDFYFLPKTKAQEEVGRLIELTREGAVVISRRSSGETLSVAVQSDLVTSFRYDLIDFVSERHE
jgi:hypothetical protein